MFQKTLHATHPDMMEGVDNETLRMHRTVESLLAEDGV